MPKQTIKAGCARREACLPLLLPKWTKTPTYRHRGFIQQRRNATNHLLRLQTDAHMEVLTPNSLYWKVAATYDRRLLGNKERMLKVGRRYDRLMLSGGMHAWELLCTHARSDTMGASGSRPSNVINITSGSFSNIKIGLSRIPGMQRVG